MTNNQMIENVARAIHFVRDETNREERERLWPECRLTRIEQAQCAIAAYNPDTRLREAATAFVAKLDECLPHITNSFSMEYVRGRPYNGPNFGEELEALRAALSPLPNDEEG